MRASAGDELPDVFTNGHNAAYDTLCAGNIGTLSVGHKLGGGFDVAANGTIIEDHTGTINFDLHLNTIDNRNDPSSRNFVTAFELQTTDVGPDNIVNATAAYKAARGL